jgi:hypothetical protein
MTARAKPRHERDLNLAIGWFLRGVLAMSRRDFAALATARDELAKILQRHDAGFPPAVIDETAERIVAHMPHGSLREMRRVTLLDACRVAPQVHWLDLSEVPPRGTA